MKKIVRIVWIGVLSGLAFLVACTASNGLTRSQRKQLTKKKQALIEQINQIEEMKGDGIDYDLLEKEMSCYYDLSMINRELEGVEDTISMKKWQEINSILMERPIPLLYGGPTIDSEPEPKLIINDRYQRRLTIERELELIRNTISERESSCIYGSPEVMEMYEKETQQMKEAAKSLEAELKTLEQIEKENQLRINKIERDLESIRNTIREQESSCVYGSPEVIRRKREQTEKDLEPLRKREKSLEAELENLKKH